MAVPQAVQTQIDQAEALQSQVYAPEAPETPTDPVVVESPAPEAAAPSNVVPLPKPAEPVTQAETPKPESAEDVAYWKQRFSTLQGKYNAEVPLLYQQLKDQGAQLAQLTERLDKREETPPEPVAEQVTSKDVEDFGADLIDLIRRVSAEGIGKAVAQATAQAMADLRKEIGAVQTEVGQVTEKVAESAADKFWASVMSLVPDWKAVDANPQWVAWLDTKPKFSLRTYRELAGDAIVAGNAAAIAELVATWRGPQAAPEIPSPAPSQQDLAQAELQRQVAPSSSRASNPAPQQGRIWSRQEYEAAMDVRNVQRLGQKEANRLEAEANQAQAEGRVRW